MGLAQLHSLHQEAKLEEAIQCIAESAGAADGDFGGEQREWHLPRLRTALANLVELFPTVAYNAVEKAKSPYDDIRSTPAVQGSGAG